MSPSAPDSPAPVPVQDVARNVQALSQAFLDRGLTLAEAASLFEHGFITAVLGRHSGNLSQAAQTLGIHRNTLRSKLRRNGLPGERSG